jgi:glycosyltransferase involved in cell wall biosynthesis
MTGAPLNILLTNATDIYGGGEYFVLELASALRQSGHGVWVCCKPANLLADKCRDRGIPVLPLDFPPRGRLLAHISRLRRMIREHAIGVIHTNTNYDRTAGAFAARLAGIRHVTSVHSFHSIRHNLTQWLRNLAATDHFIVDGFCVKELLMHHDGIDHDRITVVHLGVDPEAMRREERMRAGVRDAFGLRDEHVVIGSVGRLVPMKGQEYLLRAFALLRDAHPEARLLLVGEGELRAGLERAAADHRLDASVLFAGFRDDLPAVYSAFDLYAHPSVEGGGETFPFAVLQALAQQLPVVVTNVGDVAYMVEEGTNGFVVPDRNPEAMASRLRQLLDDPPLRTLMAANSREYLLRYFTLEKMVARIEEIYRSVL